MTNAELIQAIRNEIERRIHEITHPLKDGYEIQTIGKVEGLSELLDFLSTLQEPENPIYELNQFLINWVRDGQTDAEKDARWEAYRRFFELHDEAMMQVPKFDLEKLREVAVPLSEEEQAEFDTMMDERRKKYEEMGILKEPEVKGYDEAYLNEKIAKASKTWKGVDVDKYMDEVRGKEPEIDNEELEKAARKYAIPSYMKDVNENYLDEYPYDKIAESAFIAGAKWQKEQYHVFNKAWAENMQAELDRNYENGKKDMKEQMMKGAVECELYYDGDFLAIDLNMAELGYSERDKVRIIILKEEEK